jgi:hypothetical protein
MAHVTIAVALVGAAITIGLTIWESQKGKKRGPVIIDVHSFHTDRGKVEQQARGRSGVLAAL